MEESLRTDDFISSTINKYSDMLIRMCFSYMKNLNDAEDIAQDVFVKLMEKKPCIEEYSIAEIAAILGHKESTIGSQLHRARKLLKSSLREDFDDA